MRRKEAGPGSGGGSSLVDIAATLQVFALDVTTTVVRARKLNSILVHAPADATLATAGGFALWENKYDEGGVKKTTGNQVRVYIYAIS